MARPRDPASPGGRKSRHDRSRSPRPGARDAALPPTDTPARSRFRTSRPPPSSSLRLLNDLHDVVGRERARVVDDLHPIAIWILDVEEVDHRAAPTNLGHLILSGEQELACLGEILNSQSEMPHPENGEVVSDRKLQG